MTGPTDGGAAVTNAERLPTLRLAGTVQQARATPTIAPNGDVELRPGSGGVVLDIGLGDRASGWSSDHLEPGATVAAVETAANDALQALACVGNRATAVDGPAAGDHGLVFGKHGGVLVMFPRPTLAQLTPGDRVAIECRGVGLAVPDEPAVTFHSCSPELALAMVSRGADGRLAVPVAAILPPEAAGAGIGMIARQYNIDLSVREGRPAELATDLRFGDLVALVDQDHRTVRRPRRGWLAVGVIVHGRSVAGGHGLGMTTLLTGPAELFDLRSDSTAQLTRLLPGEAV